MKSIIDNIIDKNIWMEYLLYKKQHECVSKSEISELEEFIKNNEYYDVAKEIINEKYVFSYPEKHLINKIESKKKRIIYSYNKIENYILKLITFLFNKKFDSRFSDYCYSFRKKYTVKSAVSVLSDSRIKDLYGYKLDISNYFNSINVTIMLDKLKKFLYDDLKLFTCISNLLMNNKVIYNNEVIEEKKGIMAGVPIASFLANIFLYDLDEYFKKNNVIYIRYSDDIIFFSEQVMLKKYILYINEYLNSNDLFVNPQKIDYILPGSKYEFLGFSYYNGIIDISNISKMKIKRKIRRKAKKLRRWMIRKNVSYEKTAKVMIRIFNRKFYLTTNTRELTWSLWYFPIINTSKSLHEIDLYFQQYLRYIYSGKFCKKNYNIKYSKLKQLGYKSLVNEYYKFRK
jgi:retron-type reverse transcriptase